MENLKDSARVAMWVVGTLVFFVVVYVVGIFAFGGAAWITAPFRGEAEKRENTVGSGAFRQATYDQYFDLCSAVQKDEGTIQALKEERESASDTRKAQIDQSVTALKANRIASITDYNSKSAQDYKAAFKDAKLPYRLDIADFNTTCI